MSERDQDGGVGKQVEPACDNGVKHRLRVVKRVADDTQNLGGRGLLLQRFGKLTRALLLGFKQPHVLDGDHRLIGEGLD